MSSRRSIDQAEAEVARLRAELRRALDRARVADASLAELRRSQELTRRLIEAMPGGVVHVDADGAIRSANAEALRVLGLSYDELTQRYTRDFEMQTIREDGSACAVSEYPVTRALVTGVAQPPSTIGVRRPDGGGLSWAVFTAVPMKDDHGTTTGAVATFIDITPRKQLEHALAVAQKLESIGRLAGGIAHDFNNWLTVIVANARSLRETLPSGDPRLEDLDGVLHAAERAASLTRQLLAFARRRDIVPEIVALDPLITHTAGMLRRTIGEHIDIVLDTRSDLWPVRVDPGQFQQLLLNLAMNARDAMPAGGILTIHAANGTADDVCVSVTDTGGGIDDSVLEHLFEPFFTTKGAGAGTGLGLATCYGIVQQAGGTITVQTELGRGSTFTVRLPRAATHDERPAPRERQNVEGVAATVMLVEDDPLVRRAIERSLERLGFDVLTASSGDAALSTLATYPGRVDVLLTDVIMPRVSGPELAKQVRNARPDVGVVFMSGFTDDLLGDHGVGDSPLLRKPFQPEELLDHVRAALERSGALRGSER